MSERQGVESWAVLAPYEPKTFGGVRDIQHREVVFLNSLPGYQAKEVNPRPTWQSKGWNTKDSMSLGVAVRNNSVLLRKIAGKIFGSNESGAVTMPQWSITHPADFFKFPELVNFDVLDVHEGPEYMSFYPLAGLRRINPRKVTLLTQHALPLREHLSKFRGASELHRQFGFGDAGIVNTKRMQELYQDELGVPFAVIPNPADTTNFYRFGPMLESFGEINFLDGKVNIIYVGRLEERKGLRTALFTMALLDKNPKARDFRFIIAGAGNQEQELHRLTRELGITNRVVFVGEIEEEDKRRLLRTARDGDAPIFYAPSELNESFGNVLLEAGASEDLILAGVAYNNGSGIIEDGRNGYQLESTKAEEAEQKLLMVMSLPKSRREEIRAQALKTAKRFDESVVYGQRIAFAHEIRKDKMRQFRRGKLFPIPDLSRINNSGVIWKNPLSS